MGCESLAQRSPRPATWVWGSPARGGCGDQEGASDLWQGAGWLLLWRPVTALTVHGRWRDPNRASASRRSIQARRSGPSGARSPLHTLRRPSDEINRYEGTLRERTRTEGHESLAQRSRACAARPRQPPNPPRRWYEGSTLVPRVLRHQARMHHGRCGRRGRIGHDWVNPEPPPASAARRVSV